MFSSIINSVYVSYYIMYSEMGACICIFCIVARDLNVKVIVLIQGHGFMKH